MRQNAAWCGNGLMIYHQPLNDIGYFNIFTYRYKFVEEGFTQSIFHPLATEFSFLTSIIFWRNESTESLYILIKYINTVLKFVLGQVEIWLPAFSHFPTIFYEASFIRVVKSRVCVVKNPELWVKS